ncbi:MAG: hypothetical protein ACTTI6_01240 [Treponema sp.]|uniref:hypothetical protein n=1 Tax=Treponema sp. TaxID=166 RepID=UPI003FA2C18B
MKDYFHKMITGYGAFFIKICTFVLIFGICLLFSFAIVYPLWLCATHYTNLYTTLTLILFAGLVLFFTIKRSIKKYKTDSRRFVYTLIKKLIFAAGIAAFFVLLFAYQRLFAFIVLAATLVLYGFVAFGLSEDRK